MIRIFIIIIYSFFVLIYSSNFSFGSETVTFQEMIRIMNQYSSLPEYCRVRLAEREIITVRQQHLPKQFIKLRDKWEKKIGRSWYCFHHYCWGVKKFQNAIMKKYDDPWRKSKFRQALTTFEFQRRCINKCGGYFPLWKNLLQYEYQIYIQLGDAASAQRILDELKIKSKRGKN